MFIKCFRGNEDLEGCLINVARITHVEPDTANQWSEIYYYEPDKLERALYGRSPLLVREPMESVLLILNKEI